jgi:hypothetical protein
LGGGGHRVSKSNSPEWRIVEHLCSSKGNVQPDVATAVEGIVQRLTRVNSEE